MKQYALFVAVIGCLCAFVPANNRMKPNKATGIRTGADQLAKYLPLLKGKRVAMLANLTAIIGKIHLVQSLQQLV